MEISRGLFYLADLSGFARELGGADTDALGKCADSLRDDFFKPLSKRSQQICSQFERGFSANVRQVRCDLVCTPGDACILLFTCDEADPTLWPQLVEELCNMSDSIKVPASRLHSGYFPLKFGMDFGWFAAHNYIERGRPGAYDGRSTDTSFTPKFIIGDVVNRLARIVSSAAEPAGHPRISADLRHMMPDRLCSQSNCNQFAIEDYPDKGCNADKFYVWSR